MRTGKERGRERARRRKREVVDAGPRTAFAAQKHNLRTVASRYQATARATELCRSAIPAEQSSAFVRSVYVVARVNTRCRASRSRITVPRTSFSCHRRESAGTPKPHASPSRSSSDVLVNVGINNSS